MLELQKLVDAGYEVSLVKDREGRGYMASVDGSPYEAEFDGCTAIADTPGEALWAASPLHRDDAPYPGDAPLTQEVASLLGQVNALVRRFDALEAAFEAGIEHEQMTAPDGQAMAWSASEIAIAAYNQGRQEERKEWRAKIEEETKVFADVLRVVRHGEASPVSARPSVRITVTGDCGHVLGTWTGSIKEKYPFYCEECGEEKRINKYPWTLTTEVIAA